jgi:transcriptional regulator with XRE-family HTH domain
VDFGERLRQLREEKGLSMRQLAERSGVDVGVVSRVERGQYKPPKIGTIEKLARALDLSEAEKEELLRLSGRLEPESTGTELSVARVEADQEVRERLAAVEERVRHLEERLDEMGED